MICIAIYIFVLLLARGLLTIYMQGNQFNKIQEHQMILMCGFIFTVAMLAIDIVRERRARTARTKHFKTCSLQKI